MKRIIGIVKILLLHTSIQAQTSATWITNVNLVNTNEGKIQKGITVAVEGSTIKQVGKYNPKFKIPDSSIVIDGSGKYLMPGMVDGHIHFFQSGGLYTRPDALNLGKFYAYEKDQQWIKDNQNDLMRRYLACGITTVIDVGGPFSNYEIKKNNAANLLAPNAYVTGPLISTYLPPNLDEKDPPIIKVNNEEEARELVRRQSPYHPDFIKIWYIVLPGQPAEKTLPIVKATIDESHKHNLKVAVHATEYETAKLAVEAGCDILVHSVDDKILDPAFLQLLKNKNVTYIPTAIVMSKYMEVFTQQHRLTMHDFIYANPFMLGTLSDLQHLPATEPGMEFKKNRERLKIPSKEDSTMLQNLKLVTDAGINVVTGTDAGNIGTQHASSYYIELLAMQQAGMSNAQILKAATINAAKGFGKEAAIGSIEKGKWANLLLLNKNPLDSLQFINDIDYVINRGQLIKRDTLLQVTPESLVQQQLNAYNARNMEAFLEPFSDSVELFEFPNVPYAKGKENMRKAYSSMFEQVKELHCKLENRIVLGNTVIDQENVTGFGPATLKAVAVYKIENGKIRQVYFIQ
ncbi:MAG: amidohydrolase family protein [Chitinophagaceae bacterium]|nr:amidohydrolase family protein [Chitinophagaceae bacterium]